MDSALTPAAEQPLAPGTPNHDWSSSVADRADTRMAREALVGQRPGTLTIREDSLTPRLFLISYDETVFAEREYDDYQELMAYFTGHPELRHWIDVRGYNDLALMQQIMADFELHPLQMEDVLGDYQRAKVDTFGKAVDFAVRELLIRQFSLAQTDLWQAVAKLSENYTMMMTAVMGSVYYPRLAALATQPAAQRAWVRTVLRLLVPVLVVGLGLIYGLRHWLLPLLFEARFGAAASLLGPQLLGDGLRFVAWPLLLVLTAQARVGRYVGLQAASAVVYTVALAVLLPRLGLPGVVWASALRYALLLLWCGWYFRRFWR